MNPSHIQTEKTKPKFVVASSKQPPPPPPQKKRKSFFVPCVFLLSGKTSQRASGGAKNSPPHPSPRLPTSSARLGQTRSGVIETLFSSASPSSSGRTARVRTTNKVILPASRVAPRCRGRFVSLRGGGAADMEPTAGAAGAAGEAVSHRDALRRGEATD